MSTSKRKPAIDLNFPIIEGPVEPTEDDYADLCIPECDFEFSYMSNAEKLKALTDRGASGGRNEDESTQTGEPSEHTPAP